jgi:hypothetical protein
VLLAAGICLLASCAAHPRPAEMEKSRLAGLSLRHVNITWEKVVGLTFDDPKDLGRLRIAEGEWEIRDGALRAVGGKANRAIMLAPCGSDPVRIECDVTNYSSGGLLGDITILLNSMPDKTFFQAGYALTTGSYWNSCTSFYRKGLALANTSWSPVVSGKRNRVVFEFDHGHIRYEMNGHILLETWDESPLAMDPARWIGIRTWSTLMVVDNVVISRGKR